MNECSSFCKATVMFVGHKMTVIDIATPVKTNPVLLTRHGKDSAKKELFFYFISKCFFLHINKKQTMILR